jgi:hypothetical protein
MSYILLENTATLFLENSGDLVLETPLNLVCNSVLVATSAVTHHGIASLVCNSVVSDTGADTHHGIAHLVCNSVVSDTGVDTHHGIAHLICTSVLGDIGVDSQYAHAALICSSVLGAVGIETGGVTSFFTNFDGSNPLSPFIVSNMSISTTNYHSSPDSVAVTSGSGAGYLTYNQVDGLGGNVHLSVWLYVTSQAGTSAGLAWRSLAPLSGSGTYYLCALQPTSVLLGVMLSGTLTTIGSVATNPSTILQSQWLNLDVRNVGTNITVYIQDENGNSLSNAGVFGAPFLPAFQLSDSNLAGAGYWGLVEIN